MSINIRPEAIDQLKIRDHSYLNLKEDHCYFFAEFYSGKGFSGDGNQLITNLKIKASNKGNIRWNHKEKAMETCSNMMIDGFGFHFLEKLLFVPIPPSKKKDDPEYDERLLVVLNKIQEKGRQKKFNVKFSELLISTTNRNQMSTSLDRLSPAEHMKNMKVDVSQLKNESFDAIAIFDDVLVTGAQFKAAKELLKKAIPQKEVFGIFIARRVLPDKG